MHLVWCLVAGCKPETLGFSSIFSLLSVKSEASNHSGRHEQKYAYGIKICTRQLDILPVTNT
jgi:hypothetical protein